jgi:hypothetical protein
VLLALADGLVGVSVGDPVGLSVTSVVGVGPGDALGTPDVAEVGVAEAAVQPAEVRGSADETAATMLEFGLACAVTVAAVVAGWHFDAADERGDAVPVALVLAPA